MAFSQGRFAKVSEDEIPKLLEDKDSKNTKRATKGSKIIFDEYLNEKKINFPQTSEELAIVLKSFYAAVRKKDGSQYTKNSLCSIRFGLNRYFNILLGTDITRNIEFDEANRVYEAQCLELKKKGLAKTEHKPPIADEDIKKLYDSGLFNTDTPATLQNKVFFEIILFFCRRGRQNLRQLRKDYFAIKLNPQGQRYVMKNYELAKTHGVNDAQTDEGGMMVANGSRFCPVYSFEKYLSHLNPVNDFLFQRPKSDFSPDSPVWYDNMVVGENTLGQKMKAISKQANLSVEYTNHSIIATTITILDRCGYEARHISVSGHRNQSIKSHSETDENTKTKMARSLMSVIDTDKEYLTETNCAETRIVNNIETATDTRA